MASILDHIPTRLRRAGATNGGEHAGPCPWCGGRDRFRVWPNQGASGRYWCRRCGRSGDAIRLVRELRGLGYREACAAVGVIASPTEKSLDRTPERLVPPSEAWQEQAWCEAERARDRLWAPDGGRALDWLRRRGLADRTIALASLGYQPADRRDPPARWGLDQPNDVYLPRGITIPWIIDGSIWRLNVRRPAGTPRYIGPAGSSNGLYNADDIQAARPVVLVEGEIDALSVMQDAPGVAAVATGSTSGGRRRHWIDRLQRAGTVLVAFDSDPAGEQAARFWLDTLPLARRWRPYWDDANAMLQDGIDLHAWVGRGLADTAD
ncbi:MAG: primase-helicase zinc-binding domain-containing protein [Rhodothermales bacterium]